MPSRLPLSQKAIRELGFKAASLKYLQKTGLYTIPVLYLRSLPSLKVFSEQMNEAGFRVGKDLIAVRFSPHAVAHYQPRFWGAKTYRQVYAYLQESSSLFRKGTFLIVPSIKPIYMSTLYLQSRQSLYAEIVPGTWMTSAVSPSDRMHITPKGIRFEAYQEPRKVLSSWDAKKKQFRPSAALPLTKPQAQRLAKIFWKLSKKVFPLHLPHCLLEIQIVPPLQLEVREIKTDRIDLTERTVTGEVFELNHHTDFAAWDKKTPLLVNVPADKFSAEHFFTLLKKIPKYTKRVYIKYGMLTHPAILIREAGIETLPYRQKYTTYSFTF